MPTRKQRPYHPNPLPVFGLNDKDEPYLIHDAQAAELENIEVDENSAYSRQGCTGFGTTSGAGPIQNLYDYRKSDGTNQFLRARLIFFLDSLL